MDDLLKEIALKQGPLGALLILLMVMFRQFIIKLFEVVNNNTRALAKTSETMNEVKTVIAKCEKK